MLEALSRLGDSINSPGRQDHANSAPDEIHIRGTIRLENSFQSSPTPPAPAVATAGSRSTRELRAEQGRIAAQRRSALRRREGMTQALGISPPTGTRIPSAEPVVVSPKPPSPIVQRPRSPASAPLIEAREPAGKPTPPSSGAEGDSPPSHGRSDDQGPALESIASPLQEMPVADGRTLEPTAENRVAEQPAPASEPPRARAEAPGDRPPGPVVPEPAARASESPVAEQPEPRVAMPQAEIRGRRRRATSSFIPTVLASLLLTSLIWCGLLLAFWHLSAKRQVATWLQEHRDLRDAQARLDGQFRDQEEKLVLLGAVYERFVRMNALEAAMYAPNSRRQFEDLLDIGRSLPAGGAEEEFFKRTKERIETAYTKRLTQHRGLNVGKLFPSLGITREAELGKTALMDFMAKPEASGWHRARAAFLLRRFEGDRLVIAHLRHTIREDEDLQLVFAAWESLLALTGYDPGSKGFDPAAFDRWWRTGKG